MIRRLKQIGLLGAVFFGCLAVVSPAGGGATPAGPPQAVALATGWQFQLDPRAQGKAANWQSGRGGTGWRSVDVPHVFDARPIAALFPGTVGWYRLRFQTPATPEGFAWAVRFEQARRFSQVWLNGRYLGSHADPYTPFQLDLGALRPNGANTLVVRIDNHKGIDPREGWWNWGGLTRPVELVPQGPVTVSDLGVMPDIKCASAGVCTGRLLIDAVLANRTAAPLTTTIALKLDAPPGSGIARQENTLAPGTLQPGQRVSLRFAVPLEGAIDTWAPDRPHLYQARLDTLVGDAVTQSDHLAVGMRRVDVRGGLLYLNGRPIDLRGASIEEDAPGRGPALRPQDQQQVVDELRAVHANVTRAQYPLSEGLLERLDRAGILVWTEAPIYNRDALLHTQAQRAFALSTLRGAVLATRSHPSILTESVANELTATPDMVPGTKAYIDTAVKLVRDLDPVVPVSIDVLSYPNFPVQQTYQQFDLLGISNYYGWYAGKPGHSTANIADLTPYLQLAHERYPRQALVMSEFGAEATFAGPVGEKQTYAFQTRYVEQVLQTVAALPFLNGAIYWTLREFAVKPRWNGGPPRPRYPLTSIHHKGLISYGGGHKPAFDVASRLFAQTPFYRSDAPPVAVAPGGSGPPRSGSTAAWLALVGLGGAALAMARARRRTTVRARMVGRVGAEAD